MNASIFQALCKAHGLPEPVAEYVFHPKRKWRFDWAWPMGSIGGVALEIDGGVWTKGRHTRGAGFLKDIEKINQAVILGWRVLRCTPADVKSGKVFETLKQAMEG